MMNTMGIPGMPDEFVRHIILTVFAVAVVLWMGTVSKKMTLREMQRPVIVMAVLTIAWAILRMVQLLLMPGTADRHWLYGYRLIQLGLVAAFLQIARVSGSKDEKTDSAAAPGRRRGSVTAGWPFLFCGLLMLYYVGCILSVPVIYKTEMPVVSGILIVIFVETAMRTGLIPVNTGYEDFFALSSLKMQIVRGDGKIVLSSKLAEQDTADEPSAHSGDSVVFRSAINGGEVIWQEDIRSINRLHRQIEASVEKLKTVNALLLEEERNKSRLASHKARTALFTELEAEIRKKNRQLAEKIQVLSEDEHYQQQISEITLLLCYIKRRCNLFFREREAERIPMTELSVYIDELGEFAGFAGVKMLQTSTCVGEMATRRATLFYDFTYAILESSLSGNLNTILIQVVREQNAFVMKVLYPDEMGRFAPEETLRGAIHAAGGVLTIRELDDSFSVLLSFTIGGEHPAELI